MIILQVGECTSNSFLAERFLEHFGLGLDGRDEFVRAAYRLAVMDKATKSAIARLAPVVIHAAEAGDPDSRQIVDSEVGQLADLVALGLGSCRPNFKVLGGSADLVRSGGLFTNALYRAIFEESLRDSLSRAQLAVPVTTRPVASGVDAAAKMAERQRVEEFDVSPGFRPMVRRFT